jgi:hypothetical protein
MWDQDKPMGNQDHMAVYTNPKLLPSGTQIRHYAQVESPNIPLTRA